MCLRVCVTEKRMWLVDIVSAYVSVRNHIA